MKSTCSDRVGRQAAFGFLVLALGLIFLCPSAGNGEEPAEIQVGPTLARLADRWQAGDAQAGKLYAQFLFHLGKLEEAIAVSTVLLARKRADREVRLTYVAALVQQRHFPEAEGVLKEYLERPVRDAQALYLMGLIRVRERYESHFEEGRMCYDAAIKEAPDYTRPRYELALLLSKHDPSDGRILEECRRVLCLEEPGSSLALRTLRLSAGGGGDPAALRLRPTLARLAARWQAGDVEAGKLYALFLLHLNELEEATAVGRALLARLPRDREVRLAYIATLVQQGMYAVARGMLDELGQAQVRDAQAHYFMGLIQTKQGGGKSTEEGRNWLEMAIQEAPEFTRPRYELVLLLTDDVSSRERILEECAQILCLEEAGSTMALRTLRLAAKVIE